jgi:pimeloyl-ACP methyl ester carboxylesterase
MNARLAILSHGMESGPNATKVTALATVAEQLGYASVRPDYSGFDGGPDPFRVETRVAHLLKQVDGRELVLAGSSLGAFVSALASTRVNVPVRGLFMMAPPITLPGYAQQLDAARVPICIVHGWHDELIPAREVVAWAQARNATLHLVDDSHRLAASVARVAGWFGDFLRQLA